MFSIIKNNESKEELNLLSEDQLINVGEENVKSLFKVQ